jgi:uncharacterized protein YaaW (UPF0174 family)
VDELRTALELATEEELEQLTAILFTRKFNPLDYLATPEPIDICAYDRISQIDAIEDRFRYLAADGITVLQGRTDRVSYRQALIRVCRYLKLPYSRRASTTALEGDIFLYLMGKAWQQLPNSERTAIVTKIQRSLARNCTEPLPVSIQHDPVGLMLKGGSAIALNAAIKPVILTHIARQLALHLATYQVAKDTLLRGGLAASGQIQQYITMQMAKRSTIATATQMSAVRGVFAVLGPAMWGYFAADLGWRAISTNYGRIVPTIVALAQIRLTRTAEWEFA